MPSASVVIPTYNRAELLGVTLRSILAQTVQPLEIVVVDDGSRDHTREVCEEFAGAITYLYQENQGLPAARNVGIRASTGEWVAFCDSDDLWRPRKLEFQLLALQATGASWSISGFGTIDPDGNPTTAEHEFSNAFPVFARSGLTPSKHFGRWLTRHVIATSSATITVFHGDAFGMFFEGNVALPSTAIVARHVIEECGAFDPGFRAEETEFFHRIAARVPVAIVVERLVDYRVGHASLIKGDAEPFVGDAIRSLNRASRLRPSLTTREQSAFRAGRRQLRLRLAYTRLSALDRVGARKALYESWSEDRVWTSQSTAIMLATLLPESALRGLHRAKRAIKARWR